MTKPSTIVVEKVAPSSARPQRSVTAGLVAMLFGLAGMRDVPGVVLTRLLGDLGIGAAAARQQLARMRAEGKVVSVRTGRGVSYRLAGEFLERFEALRDGAPPRPAWTGTFHALLYTVPEAQRSYRDRLRRQALLAGYGQLQPGVLIAPRDHTARLATVLAELPDGATVRVAALGFPRDVAADAAAVAWELPAFGAALRAHLDRLRPEAADATVPLADGRSLRRMAELLNPVAVEWLNDPGLPVELYPPDWPAGELRVVLDRVRDRYSTPVRAYVDGLLVEAAARR